MNVILFILSRRIPTLEAARSDKWNDISCSTPVPPEASYSGNRRISRDPCYPPLPPHLGLGFGKSVEVGADADVQSDAHTFVHSDSYDSDASEVDSVEFFTRNLGPPPHYPGDPHLRPSDLASEIRVKRLSADSYSAYDEYASDVEDEPWNEVPLSGHIRNFSHSFARDAMIFDGQGTVMFSTDHH